MKAASGPSDRTSIVDSIDLARAWEQIDALAETPATVRARAFYVYAGLARIESPWVCWRLVLFDSNPGRGGLLVSVER